MYIYVYVCIYNQSAEFHSLIAYQMKFRSRRTRVQLVLQLLLAIILDQQRSVYVIDDLYIYTERQ